jgi:hypothetical protein
MNPPADSGHRSVRVIDGSQPVPSPQTSRPLNHTRTADHRRIDEGDGLRTDGAHLDGRSRGAEADGRDADRHRADRHRADRPDADPRDTDRRDWDNVEAVDLRAVLSSLPAIEEAKGILMLHFGVDSTTAFALLRRASSHNNVKVSEISGRIVDAVVSVSGPGAGAHQLKIVLSDLRIDELPS